MVHVQNPYIVYKHLKTQPKRETVNHRVAGSSPAQRANLKSSENFGKTLSEARDFDFPRLPDLTLDFPRLPHLRRTKSVQSLIRPPTGAGSLRNRACGTEKGRSYTDHRIGSDREPISSFQIPKSNMRGAR